MVILALFLTSTKAVGANVPMDEKIATTTDASTLPLEATSTPKQPEVPQKAVTPVRKALVAKKAYVSVDCEAFRPEVSKYDWDVEIVLAIAEKESGCNPLNHNLKDKHKVCTGSYGLLQVGCLHYAKGEDINNVPLNIAKAYVIYSERKNTFRAWTTCKLVSGCF